MDFASFDKCFGVIWLHLQTQVQCFQSFFIFAKFNPAYGFVQADGRVEGEIQRVDCDALVEGCNRLLKLI